MADRPLSPYLLPEGNVQIAFSGGRTSAYMLHQILMANGGLPDRARVIFTNTGRERPETLDFVAEVGTRWGVDIVWLEYCYNNGPRAARVDRETASLDGSPFETLIGRKQTLPNQDRRFCTEELKVKTARRWLVMQGWRRWTKLTGIRADEPARHDPDPQPRETIRQPLVAAGVTKHHVAMFWRSQPFDLGLPIYRGKTIGGNCRRCFLKAEAVVAAEMRDDQTDTWPDRMEDETGGTFSSRYSQADLRQMIERQGDWLFSAEAEALGVLCQADGGECC